MRKNKCEKIKIIMNNYKEKIIMENEM